MPTYTQEGRPIGVETPLGKDALILTSFSGEEQMSGLFNFELDMISEEGGHDPAAIIGHPVDFWIRDLKGNERWFNGYVNSFSYCGQSDRSHLYKASVVPAMWFLTRGSDCRVFQEKTVEDIVKEVLGDLGISDFKFKLNRSLETRNYCVQYRETHFDFVTRLLREEGIFYYFKHEKGKHELVMADNTGGGALYDCDDAEVQLLSNLSAPEITDQLNSWSHNYEFVSGKWASTDYDFENPSSSMLQQVNGLVKLKDNSKYEFFDYPYVGNVPQLRTGEGKDLVQARMEQEEAAYETLTSSSDCRSFSPGGCFTVSDHHNSAEKGKKWYLTVVQHHANLGGSYVSGASPEDEIYQNSFKCLPNSVVFRPSGGPMKPRVFGLQSAVVVGPSGEEIYTDEYARIKVQFHWDRYGKKDDKSSCWVRVATSWAGEKWGMVHIPRIGQEVIVDFLDGDPDRPVCTGSLYNAEQMPPYGLPDNKTQTGIKSRSSKGGSADNFNEIRFEDKKGKEEIYVHAEKDFNCVIENNETREVGFEDQDKGDQTTKVYNDQNLEVGKGSGSGSQTIEVEQDRTVTVNKGDDTLEVKMGDVITIVGQGDYKETVKLGNYSNDIKAGKATIKAMQSIELKCGASSIKLEPAKITIKSVQIDIKADAMLQAKGGAMAKVEGGGLLVEKGGMVTIN